MLNFNKTNLFYYAIFIIIICFVLYFFISLMNYKQNQNIIFDNILSQIKKQDIYEKIKYNSTFSQINVNNTLNINDLLKKRNELSEEIYNLKNSNIYKEILQEINKLTENIKELNDDNNNLNIILQKLKKQLQDILDSDSQKQDRVNYYNTNENYDNLLFILYSDATDPFNLLTVKKIIADTEN